MAISNKHLCYGTLPIQVLCSNTYIYTLTALVFSAALISQAPNFPGILKLGKACKLPCHMKDTSLFYFILQVYFILDCLLWKWPKSSYHDRFDRKEVSWKQNLYIGLVQLWTLSHLQDLHSETVSMHTCKLRTNSRKILYSFGGLMFLHNPK